MLIRNKHTLPLQLFRKYQQKFTAGMFSGCKLNAQSMVKLFFKSNL